MHNMGQKGYSSPQRETPEEGPVREMEMLDTHTAPPVKGKVGSITECGDISAPTYPVIARPAHPVSVGKQKSSVHMMPCRLPEPPKVRMTDGMKQSGIREKMKKQRTGKGDVATLPASYQHLD